MKDKNRCRYCGKEVCGIVMCECSQRLLDKKIWNGNNRKNRKSGCGQGGAKYHKRK